MIEKHILIEDIDPLLLYGVNNINMQMLKALYPKLRIVARGNVIHVMGDELEMCAFEEIVQKLQKHILKYNSLTEEELLHITRGERSEREGVEGVIVYSVTGRPICARTTNQQALVKAYQENDLVFAVGPAGSGKTYTSIALAVRALKNKEIRRIVLSRPAVEAGEKLGFLPGDMKEKIDPYLQPLYDALEDMIPTQKLREMMEQNIIQIAPLAFMRGRTLSDAVVILDEAQNTTSAQLKMFLTRMGMNTKMIVTGDTTQIDLPHNVRSGLIEALSLLKDIKGIWESLKTKAVNLKVTLTDGFSKAWNKIKKAWGSIKNKTATIKRAFTEGIKNKWNAIAKKVNDARAKGGLAKTLLPAMPLLAKGGVLTSPMAAVMGEYAGARQNPEIATPQSLMYETIQKANGDLVSAFATMTRQVIAAIENKDLEVKIGDEQIARSAQRGNTAYYNRTGKALLTI